MQHAKHENFFVIRTPRLPISNLISGFKSPQALRGQIAEWLGKKEVLESLYLASPSLVDRLDIWKKNPNTKQGKKIELALTKYFIRMHTRPTPFGLFSGVAVGSFAAKTTLISTPLKLTLRKTKLDMFLLSALKEHYSFALNPLLTYTPNSSLYQMGNKYRYIEAYQSNDSRQFRLSEVGASDYITCILEHARSGKTLEQLEMLLITQFKALDKEDVTDYIKQLVSESILVADIPLNLTAVAPDSSFVHELERFKEHKQFNQLRNALDTLAKLDQQKIADISDYKGIYQSLKNLPVSVNESKLFQVDSMVHFDQCEISEELAQSVHNVIQILGSSSYQHSNPMEGFIHKFNSRFEGQLVPLNVALDDESGIEFSNNSGYESSLIAGLRLNSQRDHKQNFTQSPSILDKIITKEVTEFKNRDARVIKLSSSHLTSLLPDEEPKNCLPHSFAAFVTILSSEDTSSIIKLNGCYGPSAANLLGRFCHLDSKLKDNVVEHLKKEESYSNDVIFAEIIHMPDGRPGNVIARPKLRSYEIVFMADSDSDSEYQLSLDDLYIWVEDKQVKLWSKRLQKQVIPRLSSAHNFSSRSLSIYKFLCTLQFQQSSTPGFILPSALAQYSFVPRIMIDDVIVYEKTWRIPKEELVNLTSSTSDITLKFDELNKKYQLDQHVCFHQSDNVLTIDLCNELLVDILIAEAKNLELIELKEALITQYDSPVQSQKGEQFNNEIIIPFINSTAAKYQTLTRSFDHPPITKPLTRRFAPGSEWLSLKVYTGNTSAENVLTQYLFTLLQQQKSLFKKWFFIRYRDPDWHIRIRFYGDPAILHGQLLPKLNEVFEPLLATNEIHKVEMFTYEREVERYGGSSTIELVEELFYFESNAILEVLEQIEDYGDELRLRLICLLSDKLLDLFEYRLEDKLKLITQLRQSFGVEFQENGELRKKLGKKYQAFKNVIMHDLDCQAGIANPQVDDTPHIFITNVLKNWEVQISPIVASMLTQEHINQPANKDLLLSSLLHMSNNRVFKAYGRENEFIIHDFMRRYYLYQSHKVQIL